MKINVLSSHRFHLLDLARELSNQGHDVRFYSYVPTRRCEQFGLDVSKCRSLLWLVWPFFALAKIAPKQWQESIVWYRNLLMDWFLAHTMRECDFCIGLGTVYLKVFDVAKRKGAITILEWGSKHIIEELRYSGSIDNYPHRSLSRNLAVYSKADYIAIASEHVENSFIKHQIPKSKLLVNSYGVDLSHFQPTELSDSFDLIMVGGWSYRKGCDLLIELCKTKGYSLLHVGPIVDLEFPKNSTMTHHDAVDQRELYQYYSRGKVFVLPSRTEGLAMVQAQAIACGLPIVCSKETGGSDLVRLFSHDSFFFEMEDISIESLFQCVERALLFAQGQNGLRDYLGEEKELLSWKEYGRRYSKKLYQLGR